MKRQPYVKYPKTLKSKKNFKVQKNYIVQKTKSTYETTLRNSTGQKKSNKRMLQIKEQ